jgi:hypothetical protein
MLGDQQVVRVGAGAVQQGQLDQQLGPDVASVLDRPVLP